MFEFNHQTPRYTNLSYKLADAVSGSLFFIAASYAYSVELYSISYIFCAVGVTSVAHIFFPLRTIRLLDYALAVTLVCTCLLLVIKSDFNYPYAVLAAVTCGISFILYARYQKTRTDLKYNMYYYAWHIGALATCFFSITAFIQSL